MPMVVRPILGPEKNPWRGMGDEVYVPILAAWFHSDDEDGSEGDWSDISTEDGVEDDVEDSVESSTEDEVSSAPPAARPSKRPPTVPTRAPRLVAARGT